MAYYPINEEAATPEMKPCLRVRTNEKIAQANAEVQKLAKTLHLHYIDVNAPLKDEHGRLRAEFTYEGGTSARKGIDEFIRQLRKF